MGRPTSEPAIVQTLDELLLIVPSEAFERTKFDEVLCDDWHLYGVDYSLTALGKGHAVCVLPLPAWHLSSGKRSPGYYRTLKKLIKKHMNERVINTTAGLWPTRPELLELLAYFLGERHKF
jgi:hypothetical protein